MKNNGNKLNKCSAFVVFKTKNKNINRPHFVDPISKIKLKARDNFYMKKKMEIFILYINLYQS